MNIITQYKIGKIRNKGINTVFQKYNWEEFKCYSIKRNEITIYLNKESLFSKKNKKIKWTVIEGQVDDIKNILEQHLDVI
jgi:cytochrome b involved in lipid metabolism